MSNGTAHGFRVHTGFVNADEWDQAAGSSKAGKISHFQTLDNELQVWWSKHLVGSIARDLWRACGEDAKTTVNVVLPLWGFARESWRLD